MFALWGRELRMAKKSIQACIDTNDIDEAYTRFKACSKTVNRWEKVWWEAVKTIYYNCKEFLQEYVLDEVNHLLTKIKAVVNRKRQTYGQIEFDKSFLDLKGEQCYLFKFYDKDGKFLCTKIGTTTRDFLTRCKEEIRYYKEHGHTTGRVLVERVVNTKEVAEGLESFLRAYFIKYYPDKFRKNDRFFGVDIDAKLFDKLEKMYAEL